MERVATACALALILAAPCARAVVYVDADAAGGANGTSWADAYPGLAAALASCTNDELWVAEGTYTPGTAATNTFPLADNALYGGFAGNELAREERDPATHPTILSGNLGGASAKSVLRKSTAGAAVLDGVTVRDGFSAGTADHGAGLHMTAGQLTVANATFTNNVCGIHGGAVYVAAGEIAIRNSAFRNNHNRGSTSGGHGGAICADSAITSFTLLDSTFSCNESDLTGGDVRVGLTTAAAAATRIAGCLFEDSVAAQEAGALYVNAAGPNVCSNLVVRRAHTTTAVASTRFGGAVNMAAGGTNVLVDCLFAEITHTERGGGGAVYIGAGESRIEGCTFSNTAASYSGASGGAVLIGTSAGAASITGCRFDQTTAGASGGAVAINGTGAGAIVLSNCTWRASTAGTTGGALFIGARADTAAITDCVFTNITAGTGAGAIHCTATRTNTFARLALHDVRTTSTGAYNGGAIYTGAGLLHRFSDCAFRDVALAGSGGGGAIFAADGVLLLEGCTFTRTRCDHTTGDSGALYVANGTALPEFIVVSNCTFDAVSGGSGGVHGGAIQVAGRDDDILITDCLFTNVTTSGNGGALYLNASRRSTIRNSNFQSVSNTLAGAYSGGAVFFYGGTTNRIEDCTFEDVTLLGTGDGGAVYVNAGDVELAGSAFRRTGGPGSGLDGGAVFSGGAAAQAVVVSNCTFEAAVAGSAARGGALYIAGRAAPVVITDSAFLSCRAGYDGGAVYAGAPNAPQHRAFERCVFASNAVATATYDGGALYVANGAAGSHLTASMFAGNRVPATSQGGALYLASGMLDLDACTFLTNSAQAGGALYQYTAQAAGATNRMTGCTFMANRADGGNGGALYLAGDTVLEHALLAGNTQTAGTLGGGALCFQGAGRALRLNHCTFHGNTANPCGGAVQLEAGTLSASNCIFDANATTLPSRYPSHHLHIDAGDSATLSYSIIDTNGIWAEGTLSSGNGLLAGDPRFHAPESGDFRLQSPFGRWDGAQWVYTDTALSPGIDAGAPTADYAAEPPPNGARANLGFDGNTTTASKSAYAGLIVINRPASGVSTLAATLNADLKSRDAIPTATWICWGRTDAGRAFADWEHQQLADADAAVGPFAVAAGPLDPDAVYYARAYATNSAGDAWATESLAFTTAALTLHAPDADAAEEGPDPAQFEVTRHPDSTNEDLWVFYTTSGTATPGADFVPLSGSVRIPAGATNANIVVTPLDDTEVEPADESMILTLAPGAYAVGTPASAQATLTDNDSLDGFAHRMAIAFTGYTRNEPLEHFPALVQLNEAGGFFHYADLADPAGGDLRFANSNFTQVLPYEVERWTPGGDSLIWVRVPTLTANAQIWALWGRPAATNPPAFTTDGSTWAGTHRAVWHLAEPTLDGATNDLAHRDATRHGHDGQQRGNAGAPARIAGGQDLVTGDSILIPTLDWAPKSFSVMFWLQPRSLANYNQVIGGVSGWNGFNFHTAANGTIYAGTDQATRLVSGAGTLLAGQWQLLTLTVDHGLASLYRNGALIKQRADMADPLSWGGFQVSASVDGLVDELRVADVAHSSNWVWACYANQSDPGRFAPLGLGWPLPIVDTGVGAVEAAAHTAILDGNLLATGAAPTTAWIHYGLTDGGTDTNAWSQALSLGRREPGSLRTTVGGLLEFTNYYYRLRATNDFGTSWADASRPFRTRTDLAAIAGTNLLGDNMDFEWPGQFWHGDPHDYAFFSFGNSFGPLHGQYMLRMLGTGGGANCDVYGEIDLARYVDAITNGNVEMIFTIHYNRIAEFFPADPLVDSGVFAHPDFFDADNRQLSGIFGWDPAWGNMLIADDDTNTWEEATVRTVVPPRAVRAQIRLSWNENANDEPSGTEFYGQYYDQITFALVIPTYPAPRPTGFLILIR